MRTPDDLSAATERLLSVAASFDDAAISSPSLLPGWTRGHVLAHLARNADGFVNLLGWAATGVETAMYASRERRDADIEQGSGRRAREQLQDLRDSAQRFQAALDALPEEAAEHEVRMPNGRVLRAVDIPGGRVREIDIHLVDLDAGLTFHDLPAERVERYLTQSLALFAGRAAAGEPMPAITLEGPNGEARGSLGEEPRVVVRGSTPDLVAWLTGRWGRSSGGTALTAVDAQDGSPAELPQLPVWA